MAKSRIKSQVDKGNRIITPQIENYDTKPPIFSLERVQVGPYCFSSLQQDDKAKFAEAIFKRKSMTWAEVIHAPRQGLGIEKIRKETIKAALPSNIKDDVKQFLSLRYSGNKAMVGYRIRDIFYVLWFDHNFTLYDH